MARADTYTWLPLDDFFTIIGMNPLHANGLDSNLFKNNVCGEQTYQFAWQHSDRIGRDDIARAIREAELEISALAGFNLLPDWTIEERLEYPQPGVPGVWNMGGQNLRGQFCSVELRKGWIISGGVRAKTAIQAGAAIVRTDDNGDGFQETCTVTVPTTVTDANEIRIYYPAKDGDDSWEIRPIKVTLSGGNAIIRFKIWQIVDASAMDDQLDAEPLDADDPGVYEAGVDVYRVYNDPATQVQFMWENGGPYDCCTDDCTACEFSTQAGCLHNRIDDRLGIVVPAPASWSVADSAFSSQEWTECRAPDQVRFWYYSGWQDKNLSRPKVELAHEWKTAIAYFAASKFDRPVCGCSNVSQFIDKWRRDAAFSNQEEGGFTVTPEMLGNKLGTTQGALYAYRTLHKPGHMILKG